jgi:hypothetical protein
MKDLQALYAYFRHYLTARVDAVTAKVRRAVVWAIVGIVAGLADAAAVVTAVVLLLQGIANGLAVLFGAIWAGQLVTGIGLLVLIALGLAGAAYSMIHSSAVKTREKEYPWAAVGVAAAAGFVAATAVTSQGPHKADYGEEPRRRRRAGRRSASERRSNRMGWLWNRLYDLIKTAITTAVASSIHSAAQAPAGADGRARSADEVRHA